MALYSPHHTRLVTYFPHFHYVTIWTNINTWKQPEQNQMRYTLSQRKSVVIYKTNYADWIKIKSVFAILHSRIIYPMFNQHRSKKETHSAWWYKKPCTKQILVLVVFMSVCLQNACLWHSKIKGEEIPYTRSSVMMFSHTEEVPWRNAVFWFCISTHHFKLFCFVYQITIYSVSYFMS